MNYPRYRFDEKRLKLVYSIPTSPLRRLSTVLIDIVSRILSVFKRIRTQDRCFCTMTSSKNKLEHIHELQRLAFNHKVNLLISLVLKKYSQQISRSCFSKGKIHNLHILKQFSLVICTVHCTIKPKNSSAHCFCVHI